LTAYGSSATYAYNGDGLRMSKIVGASTSQFVWDVAALPLLLKDGSTAYLYGPGGLPLEQINGSGALWLHHDQLGSTRLVTDSSGTSQATYSFDPYGKLSASTGTPANPLRFAGEYWDAETGLYYLRARYYDPSAGQFISLDPAVASTREPYAYVGNNPLKMGDPWGLFPAQVGPDYDALSFESWSQPVQDLYIRGRGQLQAMQEAKLKLETDPWGLRDRVDQTELVEHVDQYRRDKNAFQKTLNRLRQLRGAAQAVCELQSFGEDELGFEPGSVIPPPRGGGRFTEPGGGGFRGGGGVGGGGRDLVF
jgi:RHS repeat-associated protein